VKLVVALDSWKGSLSASDACAAVAEGLREVLPDAEICLCPMADGGEGTLDRVAAHRGGKRVTREVCGVLPGQRQLAEWLWWPDRSEGLIEMAQCAGLTLLPPELRDPLRATTRGVGELMADALEHGVRKLYVAVGGSASVDGGVGAASALGWRFLDADGNILPDGGGALERLAFIQGPAKPFPANVEVLCDVTNPLLGPLGAAAVFGPQKGADAEAVALLERGLRRLASVAEGASGFSIADHPGGGAAGGLSAGLMLFCGAKLIPGTGMLLQWLGVLDALSGADWVITGEGRLDNQSLGGKVVSGILQAAKVASVPVAVVAGSIGLSAAAAREAGIRHMEAANQQNLPLSEAMARAAELAWAAARRLAKNIF
jgi:glycerate kinase